MPQDEVRDPNEEPEDEDGEDGGEPEDEDQPEVAQPAANPVAEAATGTGPRVDSEGKPSKRGKKTRNGKSRIGLDGLPENARAPKEAGAVWMAIIEELAGKGVGAEMVEIRVARLDVGREVTLGYYQGDAVQGNNYNLSPARALVDAVTADWHLNGNVRGPVLYKIEFRVRGTIIGAGQLKLPAPEEIIAQQRRRQGQSQNPWYPQGFGAPPPYPPQPPYPYAPQQQPYAHAQPQQQQQQPPQQQRGGRQQEPTYGPQGYGSQQPQQGFGAPPGYPPHPYDDHRTQRLEEDVRELKQLLREALFTKQQPTVQQPDQLAALAGALNSLEKAFGVKLTVAGAGLGAPAAAPHGPPSPPTESQEFEQSIARRLRTGMNKRIDALIETMLDPDAEKKKREQEEKDNEEDEEDKPQAEFEMIEVPGGVTWPGTTEPIRYARDIETGEVDYLKSAAFGNPHAVDKYGGKVIEIIGKFADGIKAGGFGGAQQPQQMSPARQGLNGTGGQAPQPTQQPPKQAPAQPAGEGEDPFGL